MEVIGREEVDLPGGGRFTCKSMENGEERRRVKFPAGTRISETVASNWAMFDGKLPWQDTHFHRGLNEYYIVHSGQVYFLFEIEGKILRKGVSSGGHIIFKPGIPHTVLMGPGAVMVTVLTGDPVGNPDRNGEDWWPLEDPEGSPWESQKSYIINIVV